MSLHKPCMNNYTYNPHILNNHAGSDFLIIPNNNNNMLDLLNSHDSKKSDPTSAESSTCSHLMKLEGTNYNYFNNASCKRGRIKFRLKKSEGDNIRGDKLMEVIKDGNYEKDNDGKVMMAEGICNNGGGAEVVDEVVCSMCGDVGVAELLFLCIKCSHRHQHIYCSRAYPDVGREASMCDWCLHEEDSLTSSVAKVSEIKKSNVGTNTTRIKTLIDHPVAHVNQASSLIKELNQVITDNGNDIEHNIVTVKKGHSKAFEYLLLVAAQSLPQENPVVSEANPELNQAHHTGSMIKTTNQVISEAYPELKQANHTASMINFTNPKMGALDNKKNMNLDMKVNTSILDNNKVNMGSAIKPNINLSNRLYIGLDNSRQKVNLNKQNMDLQKKVNIRLDEQRMDVGGIIGGNAAKRQRCSKGINPSLKGINPSLKCRKKGFQLSPSRPNYRRYKLLADVVC